MARNRYDCPQLENNVPDRELMDLSRFIREGTGQLQSPLPPAMRGTWGGYKGGKIHKKNLWQVFDQPVR